MRQPRYTTPAEEFRIRQIVAHLVDEAPAKREHLIENYTRFFRHTFNSMLSDRACERAAVTLPEIRKVFARRAG